MSMLGNPLVNGNNGGIPYVGGLSDQSARRMPDAGGDPPVGSGNLAAFHNTPIHCAGLILFALVVIFGLKIAGFRFAFDVGMGRS